MITLIATVLNEGESLSRLLESLCAQTRQPDEIVVVDGGSRDNTVAVLDSYTGRLPLRVIVSPGCNISEGRNIAIAAAQGDIIAGVDAGVRIERDWLEKLTQPLLDSPDVAVVAGFFEADPFTVFEVAMSATVLPLRDEIDPATFLPSSRSVAFRKTAAEAVGGYPEWLDYCEDLVFDLRLRQAAPVWAFVPDAVVYFRPRGSLRSFFTQYYRYARGDGKADLWRNRHAIRYFTYFGLVPLILLLGLWVHPALWALWLVSGAAYCYTPYRRLPVVMRRSPERSLSAWVCAALWIPVIRVVGDLAKMTGYPVGWVWRFKNRPPDWRAVAPVKIA